MRMSARAEARDPIGRCRPRNGVGWLTAPVFSTAIFSTVVLGASASRAAAEGPAGALTSSSGQRREAAPEKRVKKKRAAALRFSGRAQVLSGVAMALPADAAGERHFRVYVPLDLEIATRVSGPLSIGLGGVGYAAPFAVSSCPTGPSPRPNALAALLSLRLDFNNSRDGSWWSPWIALRAGVSGQAGVLDGAECSEHYVVAPYFSPRLGIDLWMGRAAVTFALGYDHLLRAGAISAQVGLTLRLF